MMTKTFDCVEYQRKIRDKFFEEANKDPKRLLALFKKKAKYSEMVKKFEERIN